MTQGLEGCLPACQLGKLLLTDLLLHGEAQMWEQGVSVTKLWGGGKV